MWHIDKNKLESRLAIRGFSANADPEYSRMIPWTKFTYAVLGLQVALAGMCGFAPTLWVNAFLAALAVVSSHHLLEYFYNSVLRPFTRTLPLPANKAPTKFAFGMMSVCLALAAIAFQAGYHCVGFGIAMMIVFSAGLVCFSHICIPAAIYGFITGTKGAARSCNLRGAES